MEIRTSGPRWTIEATSDAARLYASPAAARTAAGFAHDPAGAIRFVGIHRGGECTIAGGPELHNRAGPLITAPAGTAIEGLHGRSQMPVVYSFEVRS
jgi:hypothetical protein